MSIQFAILGLLSWKPMTGYDLKKIIQESTFMYWSANNNQIYKTLIQLLKDDLATSETQHQESLPSKKIYTITGKGAQKLAAWVESPPELPEMKKSFLIQLVWAGSLDAQRLDALLENYEQEMSAQVLIRKEMKKRGCFSPARSGLEAFLWEAASDNLLATYEAEYAWAQNVRKQIRERDFFTQTK